MNSPRCRTKLSRSLLISRAHFEDHSSVGVRAPRFCVLTMPNAKCHRAGSILGTAAVIGGFLPVLTIDAGPPSDRKAIPIDLGGRLQSSVPLRFSLTATSTLQFQPIPPLRRNRTLSAVANHNAGTVGRKERHFDDCQLGLPIPFLGHIPSFGGFSVGLLASSSVFGLGLSHRRPLIHLNTEDLFFLSMISPYLPYSFNLSAYSLSRKPSKESTIRRPQSRFRTHPANRGR